MRKERLFISCDIWVLCFIVFCSYMCICRRKWIIVCFCWTVNIQLFAAAKQTISGEKKLNWLVLWSTKVDSKRANSSHFHICISLFHPDCVWNKTTVLHQHRPSGGSAPAPGEPACAELQVFNQLLSPSNVKYQQVIWTSLIHLAPVRLSF